MPVITIQASWMLFDTQFHIQTPQKSLSARDPSRNARLPIGHITTDLPRFDDLSRWCSFRSCSHARGTRLQDLLSRGHFQASPSSAEPGFQNDGPERRQSRREDMGQLGRLGRLGAGQVVEDREARLLWMTGPSKFLRTQQAG